MQNQILDPDGDVKSLFGVLTQLKINTETSKYKSKDDREDDEINEVFCKNLFLKDRKGQFYLVIVEEDDEVDLKALKKKLNAYRNFSFASAAELDALLHLKPGCVTPFALMHQSAASIRVAMNISLMDEPRLNFHPLHAEYTTAISFDSIQHFIEHYGFDFELIS